MAKYTAPISETLRQRIHLLPTGVKFANFMEKAIETFVEELEKNPDLTPDNFVITVTAGKDRSRKGKK